MAGEVAFGKHFADLHRRLRAAAGHEMLVGRSPAAIAQMKMHEARRPSCWPCRPRRCPPLRCATGRACSGRGCRPAGRRTARRPRCPAQAYLPACASARSTSALRRRTGRRGTETCSPPPPSHRCPTRARRPDRRNPRRSGAAIGTADARRPSARQAVRLRAHCDRASRSDWRPTPAARSTGTAHAPTAPASNTSATSPRSRRRPGSPFRPTPSARLRRSRAWPRTRMRPRSSTDRPRPSTDRP